MYGLEEKGKKEKQFSFDLEKKIQSESHHLKELLAKTEQRIHEMKNLLRKGADEKDFDRLGILLHGYTALQKVLRKAGAKHG